MGNKCAKYKDDNDFIQNLESNRSKKITENNTDAPRAPLKRFQN